MNFCLTWFMTSVNTTLISLWSHSVVLSLTELNVMFIQKIMTHIRVKRDDDAKYALSRAGMNMQCLQVSQLFLPFAQQPPFFSS